MSSSSSSLASQLRWNSWRCVNCDTEKWGMQLQQSSEAAESKLQATSKIMLLRGQKEHQLFIQNKEPSIWALPKISKFFVHIDCESVGDVVEDGSMYQLAPNARVEFKRICWSSFHHCYRPCYLFENFTGNRLASFILIHEKSTWFWWIRIKWRK